MIQQNELQQQLHRIEELILTLEQNADPALRAVAKELVQLLLDVHGAGLERMLQITSESGASGKELIDRFGQDELARSLLLLYELHPRDLATRVAEGLDSIGPYLRSRNAGVELISISEGSVRTRLVGSAHGCTASSLKSAIEEALSKAAPDLISITVEVEPEPMAPVFVPLANLRTFNGSAQHT
jgi:Fe-S cluster biogenesis protein NfuA